MSSEGKVSFKLKRFAGIKRDYTPEEVERLKGSIKIEHSICKQNLILTLLDLYQEIKLCNMQKQV